MQLEGQQPTLRSSDATPSSSSPNLAEVFGTACSGQRDYSRLLLALCGTMLVVAISICGAVLLNRVQVPNLEIYQAGDLGADPIDNEKTLKDVLEGQSRASLWDPSLDHYDQTDRQKLPKEQAQHRRESSIKSPNLAAKKRIRAQKPAHEKTPDDGVDPAYAALWGSGEGYVSRGHRASSEAVTGVAESEKKNDRGSVGTVLMARLIDQVAGTPARAPVIAVLTRKQRLGSLVLPASTELHGMITGTGADETRIYLEFDFVRLQDGEIRSLRGVARDPQGRHGIPAKKIFGKRAVSSVGLSSATRAVRQVGRHLAGRLGDAAGAGLEGVTDSVTDKVQRIDRDEYVLVTEPGLLFSVYVMQSD